MRPEAIAKVEASQQFRLTQNGVSNALFNIWTESYEFLQTSNCTVKNLRLQM